MVVNRQQLVDALPPPESRAGAFFAAPSPEHRLPFCLLLVDLQLLQNADLRGVYFLALGTDHPHQALRHDSQHAGGDEVVFHAHLQQPGHRARRIVGVQGAENQVTGQRRVDGDLGGFRITYFTDHDNVRVLTQDGAENVGEAQADARFHLDLVDAPQLVFDGVLHRDNLFLRRIDLAQRRVEGGGLAASGGAGHQDDPVRPVDQVPEFQQVILGKAQFFQVEDDALAVEDSQDHALAEHGGKGGDTKIDLLAQNPQLDAPVLGKPPFGDVQLGHDFYPGYDRGLEPLGGRLHVMENAVDAIAHLKIALERLPVNIAGPQLDGPGDEQVDQSNDRRLGGKVLQMINITVIVDGHLIGVLPDVLDDPAHGAAVGVEELAHRIQDLFLAGKIDLHLTVGGHAHRVAGINVVGVAHRDGQHIVFKGQGHKPVVPHKLFREAVQHDGLVGKILQRNNGNLQILAHDFEQGGFRDKAQIHQALTQPFRGHGRGGQNLFQLFPADFS